ncbi:MAG TPA: hypothetical protein VLL25_11850 [Acidimicrobiales bacterium]|nr:hypothetical protein [Acidimicrobiales bacterium]
MRWLAVVLVVTAVSDLGCGASTHHRAAVALPSSSSPGPPTTLGPTTTTTSDPGMLGQTHALPAPDDESFALRIEDLWQAIVTGDSTLALASFFPESAYLQTKSGGNNAADWRYRLLAMYQLDIAAAHALLGPDAAGAEFVSVTVPTAQAVWVTPGQEENKGSYYRVYGTRLSYWLDGKTRSFGIYSLLSWRGEWYVVHLGPNPRSTNRGLVYQPEG